MLKPLATIAAVGVAGLLAMSSSAGADEKRADGVRNPQVTDFSAHRRRYRHTHRRYYPRAYYYDPYDAYAYYPYRYYRPGPRFHVGPGGFSFGFGY